MSGAERAEWWLRRIGEMSDLRLHMLRQRNPGASDAELLALWTEQTYRGSVDDDYLARVCTAIREGKQPARRA